MDKPYSCKAPGCSKRYTDPSSLRKHVKAYKHFTNDKENPKQDVQSVETLSPIREAYTEPVTDHTIPPYSYRISDSYPINYMTTMNPTYIGTHTMYPQEKYTGYSRIIDGYRSYSTPILKPRSDLYYENKLTEDPKEDVPLNLMCTKRQCRPIEGLRHTELPLDLSTKS